MFLIIRDNWLVATVVYINKKNKNFAKFELGWDVNKFLRENKSLGILLVYPSI